jgi:hypothetical protein
LGSGCASLLLQENEDDFMNVITEHCWGLSYTSYLFTFCFSVIKQCYPSIETDYFDMFELII